MEYYPCEDNSYYFKLPVLFFQFKKMQIARELYPQGAIIENPLDHSTHIITRWGNYVQGYQQIFAQPYIAQLNQQYVQILVQNYGYIDLSFINQKLYWNLKMK